MLEEFGIEVLPTLPIFQGLTLLQTQEFQNLATTKVFPKEVAVTKVVWCMNAGNYGLYAAGTGCGLVRIEDINA
jgi:hypothetical protein